MLTRQASGSGSHGNGRQADGIAHSGDAIGPRLGAAETAPVSPVTRRLLPTLPCSCGVHYHGATIRLGFVLRENYEKEKVEAKKVSRIPCHFAQIRSYRISVE